MQVFETLGSVSLRVRLPSGRVVVTTVDEPRTTVDVVSSGRRGSDADSVEVTAEERADGHLITIGHKDQFRWGPIHISWGEDSLVVRITCPPGTNLDLSGGSTDVRVDGELGMVSVKTASGDVTLGDVARRLEVKTASGDVSTGAIGSGGQVVTVSGNQELREFEGELQARSVSGDVRIGTVRGPLQLSSTSGSVRLDSVEGGEVRAKTVSGSARIGVGRGTRVWIDATSVSGKLESDLGVEDDVPQADESTSTPVVPLQVKTVSGDVRIVYAAEASSV